VKFPVIGIGCALLSTVFTTIAGGILPDRDNQIIIEGEFSQAAPAFLLIFSAKPLRDARRLLNEMPSSELAVMRSTDERVIIKVHGKPAARDGRLVYAFGTKNDSDRPWNNGTEFRWQDWEKFSPDVWDNIAIVAAPESAGQKLWVTGVTIRKGGHLLFNSHARASYPNKRRMDASFPRFGLTPGNGRAPVLNLAAPMNRFRRDYYELGNNALLLAAYADLAQTEKRKYARRGGNWCSEFATYVYRVNHLATPDPNRGDVHWKNMREFFEKSGKVYSAREVASWPDQRKLALIKPGSFVSILIGQETHSIIFTTWVREPGKPITSYVGISGNNRGMVWPHAPLKLPSAENPKARTAEQLKEFDQKVYFGVLP
jgi:hypothetical protein